jgi:hypothetical protein
MPWAALSWEQVRHGQLPLWNPYAGFGLPLLFGFQAASLSLPMLVTYLFPVSFVFTIEVIVKLLIAGTGVLWLCRKLGLSWLPSIMAATTFELSGSFTGWLAWPMGGTFAWLGWTAGFTLMVVRGPKRALHMVGLAVSLAFAVYAGHPETLVILLVCLVVLAVTTLVGLAVETGRMSSVVKPVLALAASAIAAICLSAPLLLPGLQIVHQANRTGELGVPLPSSSTLNLLFASYYGLPTTGSRWFGPAGYGNYYESAAYIGVVVVVLAGLAVVSRWRDSRVIGFGLVALVCGLVMYSAGVSHFLDTVPTLKNIQWTRSSVALDFALAMLGGFGLQTLLDHGRETVTKVVFAAISGFLAIVVGLLWVGHTRADLPAIEAHIQAQSFLWPVVGLAVLFVASAVLFLPSRLGQRFQPRGETRPLSRPMAIGWALFAAEAVFLLTASSNIWSSTNTFFPVTPAEAALVSHVGQDRVGFADCGSIDGTPPLGILAEANSAYGLREAAVYDPVVPRSYFAAYFRAIHQPVPADTGSGLFCASMDSAALARHFGVSYILSVGGTPAPMGTVRVTSIEGEDLYRVPGGSVVTTQPIGSSPDSAAATEVHIGGSNPSSMHLTVSNDKPSVMYVHVTDFPGWNATIDGRPLLLRQWGGAMLAASIPAGHHVVVVSYMPSAFKFGLFLALLSAVFLASVVVWHFWRRRNGSGRSSEDPPTEGPRLPGPRALTRSG